MFIDSAILKISHHFFWAGSENYIILYQDHLLMSMTTSHDSCNCNLGNSFNPLPISVLDQMISTNLSPDYSVPGDLLRNWAISVIYQRPTATLVLVMVRSWKALICTRVAGDLSSYFLP